MEHLKQSDPKWKELQVLREELILVIRKAFTFEKEAVPRTLTLGKHNDRGFGLVATNYIENYSYILAYPDMVIGSIRVVYRFTWQPVEEEVCIDCISDLQEVEKNLRRMVLGFLVSFDIGGEITW